MTTTSSSPKPSRALLWTGRIISAIPVLFMAGIGLFLIIFKPEIVIKGTTDFGYPSESVYPIFIAEMICVLLYVIPQTATLGAILLTAYLGGAVATHVHASEFPQAIFPILFGILVWLGLLLQEPRLRALLPLRC